MKEKEKESKNRKNIRRKTSRKNRKNAWKIRRIMNIIVNKEV